MARTGKNYDAVVNNYLDSIRQDRWSSQGEGGSYYKGYKANPYFKEGEDVDSDAVRRRIAAGLGVTDFNSTVSYPDEDTGFLGMDDFLKVPAIMAALAAGSGVASGYFNPATAGMTAPQSMAIQGYPGSYNVAAAGDWIPGSSTLNGSVMGAEGAGAGVNAAGVTTGATASGMPSWLTPGAAFSGIGAAGTLAALGNGGGYSENMTKAASQPMFGDSMTNGGFGAPSYLNGPGYGDQIAAGQPTNLDNVKYGPLTLDDGTPIDMSSTGSVGSGSWNLPGNLGNMANWGAQDWGNAVGGLAGIGSGLYGLNLAGDLKNPISIGGAPQIDFSSVMKGSTPVDFSNVDVWGNIGGRGEAADKLKGLLSDPSATYALPGYQAGLESVQRSMAAQGYTGSGNMMAALQKYGGDFYNNALKQLTDISGATLSPAAVPQMQLQQNQQLNQQQQAQAQLMLNQRGQDSSTQLGAAQLNTQREIAGNTLASQSLASLGYGGQRLLGGPQQTMDPSTMSSMAQMMKVMKSGGLL